MRKQSIWALRGHGLKPGARATGVWLVRSHEGNAKCDVQPLSCLAKHWLLCRPYLARFQRASCSARDSWGEFGRFSPGASMSGWRFTTRKGPTKAASYEPIGLVLLRVRFSTWIRSTQFGSRACH